MRKFGARSILTQPLNEELARKRDLGGDVGVHRMFRQHVNGKLGTRLREVPFSVKIDHICIESPSFPPLRHVEETSCELSLDGLLFHFTGRRLADAVQLVYVASPCVQIVDNAVLGRSAVVIYHAMLSTQAKVSDAPTHAFPGE